MSSAALRSRRALLLALLVLGAVAAAVVSRCSSASSGPRTVEFSGYSWQVKSSDDEPIGPGPNHFSDSADNVWVDSSGRLHLKLTRANGRWYSAEVINTQRLGRGRYSFDLDSPVSDFDPNVVLALFTWSNDPAHIARHRHRGIAIKFSRWAQAANPTNGQYVVQPYFRSGKLKEVRQPPAPSSTQSFDWRQNDVTFTSSSAVPSTWTSSVDVPPPGSEHVHINLWLYNGAAPTNGRTAEVIIKSFKFTRARHP